MRFYSLCRKRPEDINSKAMQSWVLLDHFIRALLRFKLHSEESIMKISALTEDWIGDPGSLQSILLFCISHPIISFTPDDGELQRK